MTKQAVFELKKIKKVINQKDMKSQMNNSLLILERNNFDKIHQNYYYYSRLSEFLYLERERGMSISFSELIFLELLSRSQNIFNFNLLLQQTIQLLVCSLSAIEINDIMVRFFKITSWNLINPGILLKFTGLYSSLIEAKGLKNEKESKEKRLSGIQNNKEIFVIKMEKIRICIDNEDFLSSGIFINNLFRLNSWEYLKNTEKKIFLEQIIRILKKNQDLSLLSKLYYLMAVYKYMKIGFCDYRKTCIFISSIYNRLATGLQYITNFEKLLKIEENYLLNSKEKDIFWNKNIWIFSIVNKSRKFSQRFSRFIPHLNDRCINKIRKSIKKKLVHENIEGISVVYKSILAKRIKNWLGIDSRDLEYHLLSYFKKANYHLSFDYFRGVLYFDIV